MKYIDKINWQKVDEMRSKFFSTENEILAVTSTNIGTLKEPKIEAHIITADKIKYLGIIDAQRLVNAANKSNKSIAEIFNLSKGINQRYSSNDELLSEMGHAWLMRGDKVRTILGCCFKNYKVTKIENLV